MGGLAREIERLSEFELSLEREVPDDCDVELNALLGALTVDQQESLNSLNTEILQVVDAMGGCRHKCARERRSSVRPFGLRDVFAAPSHYCCQGVA